jgi:xanthosine utilization system XapX-like protein
MAMNKLLAIGLACCLPTGLAAEDPAADAVAALGTVNVMVIEQTAPLAKDILCTRAVADKASAECMAVHRAVLTARVKKVSALRERGRWM